MSLPDFGVANYRSFGKEGFYLEGLKRFNIFIGKNNCGKSNVLRFLRACAVHRSNVPGSLSPIWDHHHREAEPPTVTITFPVETAEYPAPLGGTLAAAGVTKLKFQWSMQREGAATALIDPGDRLWEGGLRDLHNHLTKTFFPGNPARGDVLKDLGAKMSGRIRNSLLAPLEKLVSVPDIRRVYDGEAPDSLTLDGSNIVAKLHQMQVPSVGQDDQRAAFELVQQFVRELLGTDDLTLQVPHDKSMIVVAMHGARLPLSSFGTGIHELVILCSALALYPSHIVCLEEPELHLHPQLQRKFMRFLRERTKNQYFITTHSTVLLDLVAEDTAVFHVEHDGRRSTIRRVETSPSARRVLDDLGCHASDLLQANAIVWVEGPSDRIYINAWIAAVDPTLVESIHYAVLFYGGSNLAHLSAAEGGPKEDFIDLLCINRHAFVVIDRDGDSASRALAARKQRIVAELGGERCWVTQGREIENYLRPARIARVLDEVAGAPTAFRFKSNAKIQEAIRRASPKRRALIDYQGNKPRYAREFVMEPMTAEDLAVGDLGARIRALVRRIREWNGMSDRASSTPP